MPVLQVEHVCLAILLSFEMAWPAPHTGCVVHAVALFVPTLYLPAVQSLHLNSDVELQAPERYWPPEHCALAHATQLNPLVVPEHDPFWYVLAPHWVLLHVAHW